MCFVLLGQSPALCRLDSVDSSTLAPYHTSSFPFLPDDRMPANALGLDRDNRSAKKPRGTLGGGVAHLEVDTEATTR